MNINTIVFPSTIPIIPNVCKAASTLNIKVIINGNNVIPTTKQEYYNSSKGIYVYVKDSLVESYRAEESWQTYFNTDKILPISEYTG